MQSQYINTNAGAAITAFAVTPSDTAQLPALTRALYIGTTGDVTVIMEDGGTALFKSVPAGMILPLSVQIVKATGTTASNIVAVG